MFFSMWFFHVVASCFCFMLLFHPCCCLILLLHAASQCSCCIHVVAPFPYQPADGPAQSQEQKEVLEIASHLMSNKGKNSFNSPAASGGGTTVGEGSSVAKEKKLKNLRKVCVNIDV